MRVLLCIYCWLSFFISINIFCNDNFWIKLDWKVPGSDTRLKIILLVAQYWCDRFNTFPNLPIRPFKAVLNIYRPCTYYEGSSFHRHLWFCSRWQGGRDHGLPDPSWDHGRSDQRFSDQGSHTYVYGLWPRGRVRWPMVGGIGMEVRGQGQLYSSIERRQCFLTQGKMLVLCKLCMAVLWTIMWNSFTPSYLHFYEADKVCSLTALSRNKSNRRCWPIVPTDERNVHPHSCTVWRNLR